MAAIRFHLSLLSQQENYKRKNITVKDKLTANVVVQSLIKLVERLKIKIKR